MSNKQNKHMKTIGSILVITLLGKVLGLVRDMMLGHHFGTGMESSAFLVASRIPRTFFDAIFASAISASFIPVFNERLERRGRDDAFRLSSCFFTWVAVAAAVPVSLATFSRLTSWLVRSCTRNIRRTVSSRMAVIMASNIW